MNRIRAGLEAALQDGQLAPEVSPDSIRALVLDTVELTEGVSGDLQAAVARQASNWARDTKVRLVTRVIENQETPDVAQLAEATMLLAEDKARRELVSDDPTA